MRGRFAASTVSPSANSGAPAPAAVRRRRVGLALMLVGLGLLIGGIFVPWVTTTCSVNCALTSVPPAGVGIAPLSDSLNGFFLAPPCAWPFWLLVVALARLLVKQEFLPLSRQRAQPALLLAGLFVVGVLGLLLVMALFAASALYRLPHEVDHAVLAPGSAVSLVGIGLFAVGGWLRYHPARHIYSATS